VAHATSEADVIAQLPDTTTVTDSEGGVHQVALNWSVPGYDRLTPGAYTAEGAFLLPQGVTQSSPLTPLTVEAQIEVREPVTMTTPVLGGNAKVGGTLTLTVSAPSDATLTYQWFRGTRYLSTVQGTSYTLQAADANQDISVKVTAARAGDASLVKYSNHVIVADQITVQAKSLPATAAVGDTVALTLAHTPTDASRSIQWFRGTAAIAGATGLSYTLTAADSGQDLVAKITLSKTGYDPVTHYSTHLLVSGPPAPSVKSATLAPAGAHPGGTLTVALDYTPSTANVTYQWYQGISLLRSNNQPVTSAAYTLTSADIGKDLVVKVTVTADGFAPIVRYTNHVIVTPAG
jgi:hypothetical protein